MQPELNRFLNKVQKTENCWLWIGAKYRGGYGHFRRKKNDKWVMEKAHRYSYEVFKGPVASNLFVCHSCDNPACVNPKHLWLGSPRDNMLDMFEKNKRPRVFRNPNHNWLSLDFARNVRKYKQENPSVTNITLSKLFNISTTQTSRILLNQIWREEN